MRRINPSMPRDVAQRIVWEESGDLKARLILCDLAEELFHKGTHESKAASAMLIHAGAYLEDREQYATEPWPKNMIKAFEPEMGDD